MKKEVTDKVTKILLDAIESGTAPWAMPYMLFKNSNIVSKKPYQGINSMITAASRFKYGYKSNLFGTYKQIQSLGGQVRSGERGIPILFFSVIERENKKDANKTDKFPIARYSTVFNADQCDGLSIESDTGTTVDPILLKGSNIAATYLMRSGVKFEEYQADGIPCYQPSNDTVYMPKTSYFVGGAEYDSTLFHEFVHSTGAKNRLKREVLEHYRGQNRNKEELIAEIGAAMLCGMCGIEDTLLNSAAYIQSWAKDLKANPDWFIGAAGPAMKAVDFILGTETKKEEA